MLKNILVIIVAFIIGSAVNMGIIMLSPSIIPLPAGVDPTNAESISSHIDLFEFKHFIFPFLAHALGTFVAAFIAAKFSTNHHYRYAMIVGVIFLLMSIINLFMIPHPVWFAMVDLLMAYIPMANLGWQLSNQQKV